MGTPATLSSVPAATPYVQYVATSNQTVFPYPFPITQDSDLVVVINGVTQGVDVGYTLSGQGNPTGGNLTFTSGQTAGAIVTLYRNILIQRITQIAQNSGFSSTAFNAEFNNIYLILQQLQESLGFALQIPNTNNPAPTTLLGANYANKYLAFDSNGNPTAAALTSSGTVTEALIVSLLTQLDIGTLLYPTTTAETQASDVPASKAYPFMDARRYGMKFDNSTNDTANLNTAIGVAGQTVNGAVGNVLALPLGTSILASEVTLPNDVRFLGTNKNGSIFQAAGSWNSGTSPFMFHAVNGTSSMFDSILESLTVDCNNIAGLGAVLSDAWQENCGLRRCLIYRFTTYGVKLQTGYGGASYTTIQDTEFYPATAGATAAIDVEQISSVGAFVMNVSRVTIGSVGSLTYGIKFANDSSNMHTVHFEGAITSCVYLDGVGSHTLENLVGGAGCTSLVEIASTFTGTISMKNCRANGATNFILDHRVGGVGTVQFDIPEFRTGVGNGYVITGITKAASAVVTTSNASAANPFSVGSLINFSLVGGMTQINGLQGKVTAIGGSLGAWTATVNINSSGFTAYTSGGTATLPPYTAISAPNTAKAWCFFDGTQTGTFAPASGFNVASITRNSAGNYTINYANPLSSANAAISVGSGLSAGNWQDLGGGLSIRQFVINQLSVSGGNLVVTPTDSSTVSFMVFGPGT